MCVCMCVLILMCKHKSFLKNYISLQQATQLMDFYNKA